MQSKQKINATILATNLIANPANSLSAFSSNKLWCVYSLNWISSHYVADAYNIYPNEFEQKKDVL